MKTMRTERQGRGGRGFTLIEILVVISIIVVLLGVVVAVGTQMRVRAQIAKTKITLKVLDGMLQDYERETGGAWPSAQFVADFSKLPDTMRKLGSFDKYTLSGSGTNTQVLDGFGTPIQFKQGGPGGRPFFMSSGPDAESGTAAQQKDDIYSYEP